MKASLPVNEPLRLAAWEESGLYGQNPRRPRRRAPLHPARRSALRQRRHPPRPRTQQNSEGLRRQDARPWPASTPPTFPAGTATACPSRSKSTSSWAARSWRWTPSPSAAPAASTRRSTSTCSARSSSAWASSAAGPSPTPPWTPVYEARIAETFFHFFENGFVYKGLKPVSWCIHDRTALAEAEVEYEKHTSPSVYVRYKLTSDAAAIESGPCRQETSTPSSGPPPRGPCPPRSPSLSSRNGIRRSQYHPTRSTSSRRRCSPKSSSTPIS